MTEVLRFPAPGPWITRDLKPCVLASDYDHLQRGFNAAISTVEVREQRIRALEAEVAKLNQWDSMSQAAWSEMHYDYELLVNEVLSEVEALRRGAAVSYPNGRDPVKELRLVVPSAEQIRACRDALRRYHPENREGEPT